MVSSHVPEGQTDGKTKDQEAEGFVEDGRRQIWAGVGFPAVRKRNAEYTAEKACENENIRNRKHPKSQDSPVLFLVHKFRRVPAVRFERKNCP